MNATEDFKVSFGRIGRTLCYEDKEGALLFCFEAAPSTDPAKKKWTIFLGNRALSGDGKEMIPASARIETAFVRAKNYLITCGYEVELE